MPLHTTLRILSIALTFGIVALSRALQPAGVDEGLVFRSVVISLGLGHYFMSLVYAKSTITRLANQTHSHMPLVLLTALGASLYFTSFPLIVYFAVHHIFNEVYLLNRKVPGNDSDDAVSFRRSSLLLNALLYFTLLRHDPSMVRLVPPVFLFACLPFAFMLFGYYLFRIRHTLSRADRIDAVAFEIVGLALIAFSFFEQVKFLHVVCYHFVFWVFYPVPKLLPLGRTAILNYLGITLAFTGGALLLSPIGFIPGHLSDTAFWQQFILWSYIHITSAAAVSTAHPAWITRWFKSRLDSVPAGAKLATG